MEDPDRNVGNDPDVSEWERLREESARLDEELDEAWARLKETLGLSENGRVLRLPKRGL